MRESADAVSRAMADGDRNRAVIELGHRHCTRLEWRLFGGPSLAQQMTGLPLGVAYPHCAFASDEGSTAGSNFEPIALDFHDRNCVGCEHRQPTGAVPNLATRADERRQSREAKQDAEDAAIAVAHKAWLRREDRRATIVASSRHGATLGVVQDIAAHDPDPRLESLALEHDDGSEPDRVQEQRQALARLRALTERAPEQLEDPSAGHMLELVLDRLAPMLLDPLRELAVRRPEWRRPVLEAALETLNRSPHPAAGRCVTSLAEDLRADDITSPVAWQLCGLAGAHEDDVFHRSEEGIESLDPSGLRAAADVNPRSVELVLVRALRLPATRPSLVLPEAKTTDTDDSAATERERTTAAGAVEALAATHPDLALSLSTPLLNNLAFSRADDFEARGQHAVARSLAVLIVRGHKAVLDELFNVGRHASKTQRDNLVGVIEQTVLLLDPAPSWPRPYDPNPTGDERDHLVESVATACLRWVGGDWGDEVGQSAARHLEHLAKDHSGLLAGHAAGILGLFLDSVQRLGTAPPSSRLHVVGLPPPAQFDVWDELGRQQNLSFTARSLLDTVEHIARADARGTVHALVDVLTDARSSPRPGTPTSSEHTDDVTWRILGLLGRIAARHGSDPSVLNAVLPVLHTHLLSNNPISRGAALKAWADVGAKFELPDSLSALLPALVGDRYVAVGHGLFRAARRLTWSPEDRERLVQHAIDWCQPGVIDDQDTLCDAAATLLHLTDDLQESGRTPVQLFVLEQADRLDDYRLSDFLESRWTPEVERSALYARACLRVARSTRMHSRVGRRGSREMTRLLSLGPGRRHLGASELIDAGVEHLPDDLLGCLEYAEVAWLDARVKDAVAVLQAALDAIPDQPVYASRRQQVRLWLAAATADGLPGHGAAGSSVGLELEGLLAAALGERNQNGPLATSVAIRSMIRSVWAGRPADGYLLPAAGQDETLTVGEPHADPAWLRRLMADQLEAAATALAPHADERTVTADYLRAVVALCDIAVRLIRQLAAELDADTAGVNAQQAAARGRAAAHLARLQEGRSGEDPSVQLVLEALRAVDEVHTGAQIERWFDAVQALPLPLTAIKGPRGFPVDRGTAATTSDGVVETPVVVALASINDRLITDTQVMAADVVHTLEVVVRVDAWPEWADRLEGTFVSHLSQAEAQLPALRWSRPPPGDATPLRAQGTVIIRFGLPAGARAPELLLKLRFIGHGGAANPRIQDCDVAGHRSVRLRPFDTTRDVKTGWRSVDERLLAFYQRLQAAGFDENDVQAFCRLLTAICRAGFVMSYEPAYRRGVRVRERDFHDDLQARLMADPELVGRVERGSRSALGYLDLRHDGITAELKVEPRRPVTRERLPRYLGQPTQYAAADGARLALLVVLDMSPKNRPIATPENYIQELQPALHGLTRPEAPSLVTAVVINGGLPVPSSWSRRRIEVDRAPDA